MEIKRTNKSGTSNNRPTSLLDDLSSGSDDDFYDVHSIPVPGYFCVPGRRQVGCNNPYGEGIAGLVVAPGRPFIVGPPVRSSVHHSFSLPAVNKLKLSTKMGNAHGSKQLKVHKKYPAPLPPLSRDGSFVSNTSVAQQIAEDTKSIERSASCSKKPQRSASFKKYPAPQPPSSSSSLGQSAAFKASSLLRNDSRRSLFCEPSTFIVANGATNSSSQKNLDKGSSGKVPKHISVTCSKLPGTLSTERVTKSTKSSTKVSNNVFQFNNKIVSVSNDAAALKKCENLNVEAAIPMLTASASICLPISVPPIFPEKKLIDPSSITLSQQILDKISLEESNYVKNNNNAKELKENRNSIEKDKLFNGSTSISSRIVCNSSTELDVSQITLETEEQSALTEDMGRKKRVNRHKSKNNEKVLIRRNSSPKEDEKFSRRSSSSSSRGVTPDPSTSSSKVSTAKIKTGKFAALANRFEDDKSCSNELKKSPPKLISINKGNKISSSIVTGIANRFGGDGSKTKETKFKNPYSKPFEPQSTIQDKEKTSIGGITVASKFGEIVKPINFSKKAREYLSKEKDATSLTSKNKEYKHVITATKEEQECKKTENIEIVSKKDTSNSSIKEEISLKSLNEAEESPKKKGLKKDKDNKVVSLSDQGDSSLHIIMAENSQKKIVESRMNKTSNSLFKNKEMVQRPVISSVTINESHSSPINISDSSTSTKSIKSGIEKSFKIISKTQDTKSCVIKETNESKSKTITNSLQSSEAESNDLLVCMPISTLNNDLSRNKSNDTISLENGISDVQVSRNSLNLLPAAIAPIDLLVDSNASKEVLLISENTSDEQKSKIAAKDALYSENLSKSVQQIENTSNDTNYSKKSLKSAKNVLSPKNASRHLLPIENSQRDATITDNASNDVPALSSKNKSDIDVSKYIPVDTTDNAQIFVKELNDLPINKTDATIIGTVSDSPKMTASVDQIVNFTEMLPIKTISLQSLNKSKETTSARVKVMPNNVCKDNHSLIEANDAAYLIQPEKNIEESSPVLSLEEHINNTRMVSDNASITLQMSPDNFVAKKEDIPSIAIKSNRNSLENLTTNVTSTLKSPSSDDLVSANASKITPANENILKIDTEEIIIKSNNTPEMIVDEQLSDELNNLKSNNQNLSNKYKPIILHEKLEIPVTITYTQRQRSPPDESKPSLPATGRTILSSNSSTDCIHLPSKLSKEIKPLRHVDSEIFGIGSVYSPGNILHNSSRKLTSNVEPFINSSEPITSSSSILTSNAHVSKTNIVGFSISSDIKPIVSTVPLTQSPQSQQDSQEESLLSPSSLLQGMVNSLKTSFSKVMLNSSDRISPQHNVCEEAKIFTSESMTNSIAKSKLSSISEPNLSNKFSIENVAGKIEKQRASITGIGGARMKKPRAICIPAEVLNVSEILKEAEDRLNNALQKNPINIKNTDGKEDIFLDAFDPSQFDTLMPLPVSEEINHSERRARSTTPYMECFGRSNMPSRVMHQTDMMLSETDRILKKSRSHNSLRKSFTRSLSGISIYNVGLLLCLLLPDIDTLSVSVIPSSKLPTLLFLEMCSKS